MVSRVTLDHTAAKARSSISRGTPRKIDTKHLTPEVTHADVYHSETATGVEMVHMPGSIGIVMDQEEESSNNNTSKQKDEVGKWNHNQPKGKSAEGLMLYGNGSRSMPHWLPLADRRVDPMGLAAGTYINYALSGTGQALYHNAAGSYLVATNNPEEQSKDTAEKERYASLRHVDKPKQNREVDGEGKLKEDPSDYKHEGKTINTEVRCTKNRIEFYVGGSLLAYIDAGKFVTKTEKTYLGDDDENKMKQVYRKDDVDDAGNKAVSHAQKVWAR